ncbi:target of Nesh-SH3-like isoform X4 [Sinocyclocheilus rhinocerous]|uniref:Target of Nesh-SH3-like n=1 Tax=Sinocyclocheilus rhinocerous TaxID=307959 RepID=A0A673N4P5_9TELE|nr:PREDICTED: target of Nesh-SH3-like isoform X4 [Sinocyclocheilus rhinocerous]
MSSVLFSLRKKDNMRAFLLLFLSEILLLRLTSATTMKVQRQNMRVRISAVGDTIVLKFIRPHVDTRLEGYILGYGSSMFSKQFIQLPEDGQPYETEIDAEPKYLIAVQSKIPEEPKKTCAGKVDLDKPLNVVIGSVTESSVLLSWGTLLTSPFMDTVLEDCFDEGQFTVRYREKEPSNTWNYQTCPSTSTVIDNLRPDALYEFVVRADTDTNSGVWSAPVIHNTADQIIEPFKELNQAKPKKPVLASQQSFLPPVPVLNNINQTRAAPLFKYPSLPKPSKTSVSSTGGENPTTVPDNPPTSTEALPSSHTSIILPTPTTTSTVRPRNPTSHPSTTQADLLTKQHTSITPQQPTTSQPQPSRTQQQTSTTQQPSTTIQQYTSKMQISVKDQPNTAKQLLNTTPQQFSETSSPNPPTTKPPIQQTQQRTTSTVQEHPHPSKKQDSLHTRKIQPSTRLHRLSTTQRSRGRGIFRNSSSVSHLLARNATQRLRPHGHVPGRVHHRVFFRPPSGYHNSTGNKKTGIKVPHGDKHQGLLGSKFPKGTREQLANTKLNQVSETKEKENIIDLKQMDPVPDLKPLAPPTTERPAKQRPSSTTTPHSVFEGSRFDTSDNSSVFSSHPLSEVDATGKKRFIAPHVIYRTDKRPEEPCSVTHSLNFFPDEEIGYLNVTGPPKTPPSNLTVVTVEGCPSFIILDWDKTDNETTEYEVVSSTKGLHGEEVSVQTTNQTHTAVENLKPESSYEFKVTPKNELGSGPASEPVTFSTESADPRVSEIQTGKNAIWSSFPFKSDSYSECNGQQFIKRTWYRKFVGIQLCNSLRYKIYLSDYLKGKFYSIGDQTGYGEDHCQFVDSFLDGRTGGPLPPDQLSPRKGFYRAMRQEPVKFGDIGGNSMINYVAWYECGIPIPGKW